MSRDWKRPRKCEHPKCGNEFMPAAWNQRYCSPECKMIMTRAEFKKRNPDYWKKYLKNRRDTRRKPKDEIPYNPRPCLLCKRVLGKTVNRWYHSNCLHRISYFDGQETYEVNSPRHNNRSEARL